MDTRASGPGQIMDADSKAILRGAVSVTAMTQHLAAARREGTGELLLTSGLLVLYVSLRGTARALGALESVVG
jgi:hypothetical protein